MYHVAMHIQLRQTSIVPGPAPTGQWHLSATYTVQCRVLCRRFGGIPLLHAQFSAEYYAGCLVASLCYMHSSVQSIMQDVWLRVAEVCW